MRNSVSEFLMLEMEGWGESLSFYKNEIERSSDWLKAIIQLNTIPGLSLKVERYLAEYLSISKEIDVLMGRIKKMNLELGEEDVNTDVVPVRDAFLDSQRDLRVRMKDLEKNYLDLKYECDEFVAATLALHQHRA